jgi:hypothetical protein
MTAMSCGLTNYSTPSIAQDVSEEPQMSYALSHDELMGYLRQTYDYYSSQRERVPIHWSESNVWSHLPLSLLLSLALLLCLSLDTCVHTNTCSLSPSIHHVDRRLFFHASALA